MPAKSGNHEQPKITHHGAIHDRIAANAHHQRKQTTLSQKKAPTMEPVMTALPLNRSGRRPARSTSLMATIVKANSVPPTMAELIRAACARVMPHGRGRVGGVRYEVWWA